MKEQILDFIAYFHLYDLILFAAFTLIAMCFVFLSFISFRKKLVSIPLFLLGFCIIIAIPFAMRYFMEERFYKIEKDVAYDRTYNYSDVYQYIATITNVGKRNISGCVFSHQILYDIDNGHGFTKYKHMALNYIKPKKIYNRDIPMDLKVGQSVRISEVMEDYDHKGEKYITKIECYGKPKANENAKILHGFYKSQQKENKNDDKKVQIPDDAGKNDMQAYTKEIKDIESKQLQNKQNQNLQSKPKDGTKTSKIDAKQNSTDIQNNEILPDNQQENLIQKESKLQSQGIPPQNILPPKEDNLAPNWREERDKFNPPLLKEMPR